ncbi:hypothetical protein Tco_0302230, partial [Tanacetum coccineum]
MMMMRKWIYSLLFRLGLRAEDEPKLLDTTIGRVVPLLSVVPARGEDELNDSVDRLFDEKGSGEVVAEEVASLQPRNKKRQKTIVDAVEPLYPTKRLRDDHEVQGGPTVGGKSRSAVQHFLAWAVLNAE